MAACVAASALRLRPAPPRAGCRVDNPTHRATRRVHVARASAAEKADPAAFLCDDRGACVLIGAKAPIVEGALLSSVLIPFIKINYCTYLIGT